MTVMIWLGVGSILGTYMSSQILQIFGNTKLIFTHLFLLLTLMAVYICVFTVKAYDIFLFSFAFIWGIQDGSIATHTY